MNAISTSAWEAKARELLAHEWERFIHSEEADSSGGDAVVHHPFVAAGTIAWIVPELLDLVVQNHDRPAVELSPRVHHILTEANFVEESGDGVPPLSAEQIEHETERIVEVLESLRQAAMAESRWSDAPVTPIMFG